MKKMARIILFMLLVLHPFILGAQTTTYFNNYSSISDKNTSTRLYSIEIFENYVIATIEITAIKPQRRINYWCTTNCYISSGNYKLLSVKGYLINDDIKPCGHDNQWGWNNVPAGQKNYYQLVFGDSKTIPSGVTNISIIDEGTYHWNGYSNSLVHSYCFRNYTINNPRCNYTNFTSELQLKQSIDANNDGVCGIYEQIGSDSNYKLACVKDNGEYKLVYISSSTGFNWWQIGDIKANLHRSTSGIFKADWFMSDKSINKDTYITFDGMSMIMTQPTGTDKGESRYLKMYPL